MDGPVSAYKPGACSPFHLIASVTVEQYVIVNKSEWVNARKTTPHSITWRIEKEK